MKKSVSMIVFAFVVAIYPQLVNINPDPNGSPWYAGGYVMDTEEQEFLNSLPKLVIKEEVKNRSLPSSWDNMNLPSGLPQCFRPIFLQEGSCCAQAAMIGYVYTFEINRSKIASSTTEARQYPTHFTYNYVNGGNSTTASDFMDAISIASEFGVPNSEVWREVTGDPMAGPVGIWMSGYDKYYNALRNKMIKLPGSEDGGFTIVNNADEESLETLKYFLFCHNIEDSQIGGVVGCGTNIFDAEYVNLGDAINKIPFMISPATSGGHAMTIAGYDDTIAYDFDVEYKQPRLPHDLPLPPSNYYWDGTPKPMDKWEVGALKVVNSWGTDYPFGIGSGYTYIPYRFLITLGNYFTGIEVRTNYQPEVTYKVEMQHHNRNTIINKIRLADGDYSETHTYYGLHDEIGYCGNFPMRGPENYNPIEFCLDVSQFYIDSEVPKFTPSVYSFIVQDEVEDAIDPYPAPPGFVPMINNFELIDYKFKELHIRNGLSSIPITDKATTEISIIYNRILENIEGTATFHNNIGIPYPINLRPNALLSVTDGTKVYLHDTTVSSLRPLSGSQNEYAQVDIQGDAEFIGFDETTNDQIFAAYTKLSINNSLRLENCNMIIEPTSLITLAENARIIVSNGSELIIYPNSNIDYGIGSEIILENGGKLTLIDNTVFSFNDGSELIISDPFSAINFGLNSEIRIGANSSLLIDKSSNLNIPSNSKVVFEQGSFLNTKGDVTIKGNIEFSPYITINAMRKDLLTQGSHFLKFINCSDITIPSNSIINLSRGVSINIEEKTNLFLGEKVRLNGESRSELIIGTECNLTTLIQPDYSQVTPNNFIEFTGDWNGINCEAYSNVALNRTKISGAVTAINGSPLTCRIEQCEFTNCGNGINIASDAGYPDALQDLMIKNCKFTGNETGTGISLTQTDGQITGNTINNYYRGMNVISCSPSLIKNTIQNNKHCGLYITGYNAAPQLNNPLEKAIVVNNIIKDNGEVPNHPMPTVSGPSQISVVNHSYIYLDYGLNNIYSTSYSFTPDIPCVRAASLLQEGEFPRIQIIYARNNYWGEGTVNDDYFTMGEDYRIVYNDKVPAQLSDIPLITPLPTPESKSYDLLMKALESELNGKYDKAIKTYEKIIEKYPDSQETIIAYAKLPDSYEELNLDLNPLLSLYDAQLASTDVKVNKKFFKEMKVATNLKIKKYDEAISISEEMKLEADTEEEIILCDIDIAIANMMKDAENGSKGKSKSYTSNLSDLINKLTGNNSKSEPAGITENILPSEVKLYQNYPNPFNPVTQIRFDLAVTSSVKLKVYNVSGQAVAEFADGVLNAGNHTVDFDGSRLNSGIYYYTLEVDGRSFTQKMILMK